MKYNESRSKVNLLKYSVRLTQKMADKHKRNKKYKFAWLTKRLRKCAMR